MRGRIYAVGLTLAVFASPTFAQDGQWTQQNYVRNEYRIPMRDGVKLFTVVFSPKDPTGSYPMLMRRTPYGVHYQKDAVPPVLGPNRNFLKEGYIFVYQDVRGCYMSEGKFENMRPHIAKKTSPKDIDESSDTYDTIDWLVKNVPHNNGKVGLYGISYPGFYCSAGMIDAHPALKAVSPQAPIADWFFDDFFHHGAFFYTHAFNFFSAFGHARPEPTMQRHGRYAHGTQDGYQFFLDIGSLKNVDLKHFKGQIAYWNTMAEHPNRDAFWQARDIRPHLKNVAPAVMTVGGWFDAEDLFGPLQTYRAVEKQNPNVFNVLVMGPWYHGQWSSFDGTRLGNVQFGSNTADFFQKNIELPFFNHYLKGEGEHNLPEAFVFETGTNRWQKYDTWPPKGTTKQKLFLQSQGRLSREQPMDEADAFDDYISDPKRPVPYTEAIVTGMSINYMTDDQRFASRRPDVVTYQTEILKDNITLAGPIRADLWVSTTGTDSDWIVKVIDVFPNDAAGDPKSTRPMQGYQMHVRSEVIRGRFRNSYEKPEPFVPDQPTLVKLDLQDVLHTFQRGHRIMIQIHSTWFPLVDRNPQKFVPNIFRAEESDFIRTTQRVYRSRTHPTAIEVGVLQPAK